MRTIPAQSVGVIATPDRSDHVRVDVDVTGAGGWQDMGSYLGADWLESLSWGGQEDQPGQLAEVRLHRRRDLRTLAPLMALSSGSSALRIGRGIRIYAAVLPLGTPRSAVPSWDLLFDGTIDLVEWGGEVVVLSARDKIAALQNASVKVEGFYPSEFDARATGADALGNWTVTSTTKAIDTAAYWIPYQCLKLTTTGASTSVTRQLVAAHVVGNTYLLTIRVKRDTGTADYSFNLLESGGGFTSFVINPTSTDDWLTVQIEHTTLLAGSLSLFIATNAASGDAIWVDDIAIVDTTAGLPVEDAIQEILDTWIDTPTTLVTPVSPGYQMNAWHDQEPMKVHDSIMRLADLIGWELRYRWDGISAFELRLYEPDRAAPSVDRTFSAETYYEKGIKASEALEDVRNAVRVVWYEDTGQDELVRRWVDVRDLASIAEHGEIWFQITEGSTSPINSLVEATALANAALSDLATARFDWQVPAKFFPWVELGDYYRWSANAVHFDSDQDLAVLAYSHAASGGGKIRTEIRCAGAPRIAQRRWLRRESGPGSAPFAPFTPPWVPSDSAGTNTPVLTKIGAGIGLINVGYERPSWKWWDQSEIHAHQPGSVGAPAEFAPTDATRVASGKLAPQMIYLTPGTGTWYIKVRHRDRHGNVSTSRDASVTV